MPVIKTLRERTDKPGAEAKGISWNDLPNEVRHSVLAHAVVDEDLWKANQTYANLSATDRRIREELRGPKSMKDYKSNLDEGRKVARAVREVAFPDKTFSDNSIWDAEISRNIKDETDALMPVLPSYGPNERLDIVEGISKLAAPERLSGYERMLHRPDLLPQKVVDEMVSQSADVFKNEGPDGEAIYPATYVLAIGCDAVSPEVRDQVMKSVRGTIAEDPEKRTIFAEGLALTNPSVLKHEEFRTLVREEFEKFENPASGIAALACHIDKNDRSQTDFIIDTSFRFLDADISDVDDHILAAAAIAKVADGNVSPENKARIETFRVSENGGAYELEIASRWLKHVAPQDYLAQPDPQWLKNEHRYYENSIKDPYLPDAISRIPQVKLAEDLAYVNEKHMNSARQALMDTERRPRER